VIAPENTPTEEPNGRVLLELKDGRLAVYPMAETDEETARLLEAISKRVMYGDLGELLG
jgi:hypothetical protein